MAKLKTEYTDIKNVKHTVEHLTVSDTEDSNQERVTEELLLALTRPGRRVSA